ncbi:hypothetical protein ACHQM5_023865 [Ranunculus cassubicifolius]
MSSSSTSVNSQKSRHVCYCGILAKECISWTTENPGRRFQNCATKTCDFWSWLDDKMTFKEKIMAAMAIAKADKEKIESLENEKINLVRENGRLNAQIQFELGQKKKLNQALSSESRKKMLSYVISALIILYFFNW